MAVPPAACWDEWRARRLASFEERALALLECERPGGVASCVVPRAEGARSAAHDSDGLFLLKTKMQPEAQPGMQAGK